MFVGHYSAALAAKAAEPRAPLWTYVIACQAVDVGWSTLIMTGAEKMRVDPSLPGSSLDLYQMPWTHSLPGALAWSIAGGLLAVWALKLPRRAGVFVGLVVFSQRLLDLLVHRPDLELWPGGTKLGLALWNYPVPEQAIEIGLIAVAAVFWAALRVREGRAAWPAAVFVAALVALQLVGMVAPMGDSLVQAGLTALAAYGVVALLAWAIERRPVDAAARLRGEAVRA
jgi:hypothetical protein